GIQLQVIGKAQQLLVLARQVEILALGEQLALALHRQLRLEHLPVAFTGRELQLTVLIQLGANSGLAQAAVEAPQDLLVAHLVVEHHRHRLGQLTTAAEQQRLAAGLANLLQRLQSLQTEAAAHRLVQAQPEVGVQRVGRAFGALLEQRIALLHRLADSLFAIGRWRADLAAESQLELRQTRLQIAEIAIGRLHRGKLLVELQTEAGALACGRRFRRRGFARRTGAQRCGCIAQQGLTTFLRVYYSNAG